MRRDNEAVTEGGGSNIDNYYQDNIYLCLPPHVRRRPLRVKSHTPKKRLREDCIFLAYRTGKCELRCVVDGTHRLFSEKRGCAWICFRLRTLHTSRSTGAKTPSTSWFESVSCVKEDVPSIARTCVRIVVNNTSCMKLYAPGLPRAGRLCRCRTCLDVCWTCVTVSCDVELVVARPRGLCTSILWVRR